MFSETWLSWSISSSLDTTVEVEFIVFFLNYFKLGVRKGEDELRGEENIFML